MAVNMLRRLLEQGILNEQDLAPNELAQLMGEPMPQPRMDIAPMQPNSMRFETGPSQGQVTPLDFNGPQVRASGYGMPPADVPAPMARGMQHMKVAGYGNDGIMSDLGQTDAAPVALDYSRPAIQTPKGKGYYGKDGQVYVKDAQGGMTQIRMGYDRDASYIAAKRDFEKRKAEQDIAQSQATVEHTQEATQGLRAAREVKEDPFTQASLEKRYGKAEKGLQWTPDGKLVAAPGGTQDISAQSTADTGHETLRKIDEMIGKRDAQGKLVEGSKPHAGFEGTIGATWKPGARLIPGTSEADFDARLNEVKGGAFLKAFETLKGGGQITEVEGKKATDAITRMNRSQSEDEFVKAALEFRGVVQRAMERTQSIRQPQSQAQPMGMGEKGEAIFKAKKAIAAGADPALVKQRLESAGIRDHGL